MQNPFDKMSTFKKIEQCFNCMMQGEVDANLRNYFWALNSIVYNYERKKQLLVSKEELSKIKFFNVKLLREYAFPETYIQDIEIFNQFESNFREKENNSDATI